MVVRERLPDLKEDISPEIFHAVRQDMEVYFYRRFRENFAEEDLEEISDDDLREATEMAIQRHESNEEFVKDKTKKLAGAFGFISIPVGNGSPIQISGSHVFAGLILAYGRLFGYEVDLRRHFIENLAFDEATGNKWVDNRRRTWNLLFYRTKFLGRMLILCYLRAASPHTYKISIEQKLSAMDGTPMKERLLESAAKWQGKEELDRMAAERESFPIEV